MMHYEKFNIYITGIQKKRIECGRIFVNEIAGNAQNLMEHCKPETLLQSHAGKIERKAHAGTP